MRIKLASGATGEWAPESTPYMVEPMNAVKARGFEAVVFVGPARSGKALDVDTPIPTPGGWTTMGALSVGDIVYDEKGKPSTVVFATEYQHGRDCYKVSLADGSHLIADADHLWAVERFYWKRPQWRARVMATSEILADGLTYSLLENGRKRYRFRVRNAQPIECASATDLAIDPYVLGLWLGDGSKGQALISAHKDDAQHYVDAIEAAGHVAVVEVDKGDTMKIVIDRRERLTTHCQRGHEMDVVGRTSAGYCMECNRLTYWRKKYGHGRNGEDISTGFTQYPHSFQARLHVLNLIGNKHIPSDYLRAPEPERWALLRGLMDTDGSFDRKSARVEFSNTSPALIGGFCELARSLGLKPIVSQKRTTWTYKGINKEGVAWRVCFPVPGGRNVFSIPRKADNCKASGIDVDYRQIVSIEPVASRPVKCIQVDSPSHIYLAGDGMVPTHNTLALLDGVMTHAIVADPGDFGLYFSTQPLAHDWRKRRLEFIHRNAPDVRAKLSPRMHDTNIEFVHYRHGMIANLGWPSSSQLAQRDLRHVALSDYDSFPDDIGGEGSGFDLAKKRVQVAGSAGITIVESSPKREIKKADYILDGAHAAPPVDGGILPLYNRGDRRRWHWQCIDGCGEWFEAPACPAFDDVPDIAEAAESAHVACPHCGQVYRQADKQRLNASAGFVWVPEGCRRDRDGNLLGTPRRSTIASFWMFGCAAAFQSWSSIVTNELTGRRELDHSGDERALKTARNVDQALPYKSIALKKSRTSNELAARAEIWERYTVPIGVRTLIAFVDNQKDRFEVRVWGYGVGRERWLIDAFSIREWEKERVRPATHAEHWDAITQRVVHGTYRLPTGQELRIWKVAVDSAGYAEDQEAQTTLRAYDWWRSIHRGGLGHRVRLIKGSGSAKVPIRETYPDSRKRSDRKAGSRGDVPVFGLGSNLLKDAAFADLSRDVPGPGYIHLPEWAPPEILDELVAETREPKGWILPQGRRNETWDSLYCCDALWRHYGGDRINWDNPPPWASADWAVNPEVISSEQRRELKAGTTIRRRSSSWL